MRWGLLATVVLLGAGGLTLYAAGPEDPLVVHEWGTFTSMQGSDGGSLEGLQHEEEALPRFVYDRSKIRQCTLRRVGYKGLEVPVEHVTQKMETPVIYFHTKTPRRVRVHVDFVEGLLTQWYPVSDLLGPKEGSRGDGPLDMAKVERSFLEWDVDLLPDGKGAIAQPPGVSADDPWGIAREVSAALVQTVPRAEPRIGPTEAERYIFYRGLGRFTLPVHMEGDTFVNGTKHVIPAAIAVCVGPEGSGCFADLGAVEDSRTLPCKTWKHCSDADALKTGLGSVVREKLLAQGLEPDEATAMVKTWSRSWFTSEGNRILYVVPRECTDAIIPLTITPRPEKLVRVLVGRLEYLTQRTEAEVETAIKTKDTARLARLGRFLEPNLRRIAARTEDEDVKRAARELLDSCRESEGRSPSRRPGGEAPDSSR
jgi:hypothetical protein